MNGTILNLGPLEILFVLILALLVLGPERLPGLMRGFGTALRRIREMYVSFVTEFRNELQPIAEEVDSVTREIQGELAAIREAADIRSVLQPITQDINTAADLNRPLPAASSNGASADAGKAAQIEAPEWGYPQLNDGAPSGAPDGAPDAEQGLAEPEPVIAPPDAADELDELIEPVPPRPMTVEEAILGPHREAQRAAAAAADTAAVTGVASAPATPGEKRAAPFSLDEPQPVMDTSAASAQYHRTMLMASFSRTKLELRLDNPWSMIEPPIRKDQLDEDSPWKG